MISQYLYISTAPKLTREDVDRILESASRNNAASEITGMLLYNGRNFLQLLEGDEAELIALMVRIMHDPRHTGVSMLRHAKVPERAFPEWSMRRIMLADDIAVRRKELEELLPKGLDPAVCEITLNFATLN